MMGKPWRSTAAAFALVLLLSSQQPLAQAPADGVVALTGARLIDGTGRAPIDSATLVIDNGRVSAVGPGSAVAIPEGATRVALDGKTIVPGLVNAHGHVQVEQASTLPVRDDLLRRLRMY